MELVKSDKLWAEFLETNGYRLDKCIGQGSFGDVYAVSSLENDQPWAVKRLVARRDIREDSYAMGEIAALASIDHPLVVALQEVLTTPRLACLVMELAPVGNLEMFVSQGKAGNVDIASTSSQPCDNVRNITIFKTGCRTRHSQNEGKSGINLISECSPPQSMLNQTHNVHARCDNFPASLSTTGNNNCGSSISSLTLEPAFLTTVFFQVTSAVSFCHSIDLAHRDINPSNVLIFNKRLVKLADFGLCFRCREDNSKKSPDSRNLLKCADYLGNEHYLAPEVRRHEPFLPLPADVWSLGCLLYFLLQTNHPPVTNSDLIPKTLTSNILWNTTSASLIERCRQTFMKTCTYAVPERSRVEDILGLWDVQDL